MPQTSKPRAGASSGPDQGKVVLMAAFLNHFYKTSLRPSFSRVESRPSSASAVAFIPDAHPGPSGTAL